MHHGNAPGKKERRQQVRVLVKDRGLQRAYRALSDAGKVEAGLFDVIEEDPVRFAIGGLEIGDLDLFGIRREGIGRVLLQLMKAAMEKGVFAEIGSGFGRQIKK